MSITNLEQYRAENPTRPREITFHSATYRDKDGNPSTITISVRVEDGNVSAVLDEVIGGGGIGETAEGGNYMFIPWPCAAVVVRDL